MKKVNLLGSYPNPKNKRYVSENLRTIKHRIVASYRGKEFYDGRRIFGYGGFNYDGRCGNFGKYALVFTNNTLIKACKIGEIYTQFGEYAIVNDCEDCDDMEVKNLLKY